MPNGPPALWDESVIRSLATTWLKGKTLEEAQKIKNKDIADELVLPPVKIHCSVLAEAAIRAAISDYRSKQTEPPRELA
jgi:nitrogen fixation NifU-like protein